MSRHLLALCLAFVASTYAAQAQDAPAACAAPAKLDDGWTMATPKDAGFDSDKLCALDKFISQWTDASIHGVVIVRHGKLVMERYYKGINYRPSSGSEVIEFGPTVKHSLFSISKSVTSLLIGIARGEGKLPDLDEPAINHLPAKYADMRTPENARITTRDLLSMSSGLDWDEVHRPYSDPKNSVWLLEHAPDPYRFVLQQSVTFKPGEIFNYNSGGTELLGLLLANSVGQSIDDYARDKLFGPLGIDFEWVKLLNSGQPSAAGGLRLRPRDMAKLGQLLLTDGQWDGKQVVPKGWIGESTKSRVKGLGYGYGYQWWLGRSLSNGRDMHWTAAFGAGGQRLFVLPESELVVAITAGLYAKTLSLQDSIPLEIFTQHVLPAISGD